MYQSHWKLKEKPFQNTPDPRFFFHAAQHEEALARLTYTVTEDLGAGMLSGIFGCGKTLIIRALPLYLTQVQSTMAIVSHPTLDGAGLLRDIVYQLGVRDHLPKEKSELLHILEGQLVNNFRDGRRTVIIIDEAHSIEEQSVFEELRLILNFQQNDRFLLTLILSGQPELKKKVDFYKQFSQRIAMRAVLDRLSEEDTGCYIAHRLNVAGRTEPVFTPSAVSLIHTLSGGIPRRINTMCDMALIAGALSKAALIEEDIINEAGREMEVSHDTNR